MKFLMAIVIFYYSITAATSAAAGEVDLMALDQEALRVYLRSRISDELGASKKIYSGYFALPRIIASRLPGQNVLEVGCGSGPSIRAFAKAGSVSAVEPDIDALAMGFSPAWTKQKDTDLTSFSYRRDETFLAYAERMGLDTRWIRDINPDSSSWIPDSVCIYPTTLENLPASTNRSFDLIAYQNFNIVNPQYEGFFRRLSEIVTLDGTIVIEFLGGDYMDHNKTCEGVWHGKLKSCIEKYFTMEQIMDEKNEDYSDSACSEIVDVPCIRFVVLKLKP